MTAAVIALATCIAGALSLIGWLSYRFNAARNATSTEREAHSATRMELERERLQHDITRQRLAQTDRINAALQEALDDAEANGPSRPAGDIVGRLRDAAAKARRGGAVRDVAAVKVSDAPATSGAHPALMPLDD